MSIYPSLGIAKIILKSQEHIQNKQFCGYGAEMFTECLLDSRAERRSAAIKHCRDSFDFNTAQTKTLCANQWDASAKPVTIRQI